MHFLSKTSPVSWIFSYSYVRVCMRTFMNSLWGLNFGDVARYAFSMSSAETRVVYHENIVELPSFWVQLGNVFHFTVNLISINNYRFCVIISCYARFRRYELDGVSLEQLLINPACACCCV